MYIPRQWHSSTIYQEGISYILKSVIVPKLYFISIINILYQNADLDAYSILNNKIFFTYCDKRSRIYLEFFLDHSLKKFYSVVFHETRDLTVCPVDYFPYFKVPISKS